ncbi:MAG: histidine phosphatase family protein [Pseudonocardiales bacterium]|nr:MAG: histidine phosphatase family protein [Pseudonocardiales bacterium]
MTVRIVFETHSWSEDNEHGIATGWLPGRLSGRGRTAARELGRRRRPAGFAAVFASDLARAVETAQIAFAGSHLPILLDWRLRECDYGDLNGALAAAVRGQAVARIESPFPGGESWERASGRVHGFLRDLPTRWAGTRVLVIGHQATRFGFERYLCRRALIDVVSEEFRWRPGWEYVLDETLPC